MEVEPTPVVAAEALAKAARLRASAGKRVD